MTSIVICLENDELTRKAKDFCVGTLLETTTPVTALLNGNNQVVGVCGYIDSGKLIVRPIELSVFVEEGYRSRTLSAAEDKSLITAAVKYFRDRRDTTYRYVDYVITKVVNDKVTDEIMSRLGFGFSHVGSMTKARVYKCKL